MELTSHVIGSIKEGVGVKVWSTESQGKEIDHKEEEQCQLKTIGQKPHLMALLSWRTIVETVEEWTTVPLL